MSPFTKDKSPDKSIISVKQKLSIRDKLEIYRALLSRNFILWSRFKISALIGLVSAIVGIAVFFFINFWIGDAMGVRIAQYGYKGDFFRYVLLGLVLTNFAGISLTFYLSFLKSTYFNNWLEMVLSSPISFSLYFSIAVIWVYVVSAINVTLHLGIGAFMFGADISIPPDFWLIIVIILLTVIAISGIGLMAASMFLLFDVKGSKEPISWFFSTFAGLVSGMMFPPELFLEIAPPLYYLSRIFPHTYAMDAFRRVMDGAGLGSTIVMNDILILIIFCIILLPLGTFMFRRGIVKAERTGKLARWGA